MRVFEYIMINSPALPRRHGPPLRHRFCGIPNHIYLKYYFPVTFPPDPAGRRVHCEACCPRTLYSEWQFKNPMSSTDRLTACKSTTKTTPRVNCKAVGSELGYFFNFFSPAPELCSCSQKKMCSIFTRLVLACT